MILLIVSLGLLNMYTGMKLLSHSRKEMLGRFFVFVSWFIIVGGFALIVSASISIAMHPYRHWSYMENTTEIRAEACDHTCVHKRNIHRPDSLVWNKDSAMSAQPSLHCKCCKNGETIFNSMEKAECCKKDEKQCNEGKDQSKK